MHLEISRSPLLFSPSPSSHSAERRSKAYEARRITGAGYKASSDAVHGAGRLCEREEAEAGERRKERD